MAQSVSDDVIIIKNIQLAYKVLRVQRVHLMNVARCQTTAANFGTKPVEESTAQCSPNISVSSIMAQ